MLKKQPLIHLNFETLEKIYQAAKKLQSVVALLRGTETLREAKGGKEDVGKGTEKKKEDGKTRWEAHLVKIQRYMLEITLWHPGCF